MRLNGENVHFCSRGFVVLGQMLLLMVITSCSGSQRTITRVAGQVSGVRVCRVALLPFVNESRSPQLGAQAHSVFYSEIVKSGLFRVEPEGDLQLFYYRNRIRPNEIRDRTFFTSLSQQLEVEGVVVAYIRESNLVAGSSGSRSSFVSLQVELHDARSGRLLLSSFLRRTGDDYTKVLHFGVVDTVSGLLQRMAQEIITEWQEKGVSGCQ